MKSRFKQWMTVFMILCVFMSMPAALMEAEAPVEVGDSTKDSQTVSVFSKTDDADQGDTGTLDTIEPPVEEVRPGIGDGVEEKSQATDVAIEEVSLLLDAENLIVNDPEVKHIIEVPGHGSDRMTDLKPATIQLTEGEAVGFASSNEKIATVSEDGIITPHAYGQTVLTVTLKEGKTYKLDLDIVDGTIPTRIDLDPSEPQELKVGKTLKIGYTLHSAARGMAASKIKWTSDNKKVATVNASGKVSAKGAGIATITATTVRGKCQASVDIRVIDPKAKGAGGIPIDQTNFPDERFREVVRFYCDTDNDGALSKSEIKNVKKLRIDTRVKKELRNISSLQGIERLTSLEELYVPYLSQLTTVDLTKNTRLTVLEISGNMTDIDLTKNTRLIEMYIGGEMTEIDLSKNTKLKKLECFGRFEKLDLSKNTELVELSCGENEFLTNLDISQSTKLKVLYCWGRCRLTSVDLTHNTQLEELYCGEGEICSLDLSRNPKLRILECEGDMLNELDVSHNPLLEKLQCNDCGIKSLDVSHNPRLRRLICSSNPLTSLDISKNKYLIQVTKESQHTYHDSVSYGQWRANYLTLDSGVQLITGDDAPAYRLTKDSKRAVYIGKWFKIEMDGKAIRTCTSSKPKVASVKNGVVTPLKAGKTVITVTPTSGNPLKLTLTVKDPTVPSKVSFDEKSITLHVGEDIKPGITVKCVNGYTAATTLTWTSSKPKVASVEANGRITARKKGTAQITVKTSNGKKATMTVKVVK